MSSAEANYSVTFKTPKGNLITVRGDSALDWVANLNAAGSGGALGIISQIEASLSGQATPSPAPLAPASAPDVTYVGPGSHAPKPSQELPEGYGVKCTECGGATRFVQEGRSKQSGQPYKRYACTVNQLHKSTFTN